MDELSVQIKYELTDFIKAIEKTIPQLSGGFLGMVGSRARTILKEKYLSGQELNLFTNGKWGDDKDSVGRRLLASDVNKSRTETKIYSYPVNLFEKGRGLRDGSREAGKDIITGKLKQDIMSNMASYSTEYDRKMQKDLDKL